MKALPFKIPKSSSESIFLQTDDDLRFYDKLHQHDEFQLTCILSGTGTFMHGGHVETFGPGDIYLIGGGMPHLFRSDVSTTQRAVAKTIFFEWELLQNSLGQLAEYAFLIDSRSLMQRGGTASGKLRSEMASCMSNIFASSGIERLHSFLLLLHQMLGASEWKFFDGIPKKNISEQDGRRLDEVFDYTLDNFNRQITLDEIASVAHMNVTSFCRYFNKHTRKSYMTFLNEYRIQQACKLLGTTDDSILSIAMEVGFNNLSNFNRQFKRTCGIPPRSYRKKVNLAFE